MTDKLWRREVYLTSWLIHFTIFHPPRLVIIEQHVVDVSMNLEMWNVVLHQTVCEYYVILGIS